MLLRLTAWCWHGRDGREVKRRGDAYISLVGYDDVVSAALKIYDAPADKVNGNVFIVADGHEQTVESVFEHGHACLRAIGEEPVPVRAHASLKAAGPGRRVRDGIVWGAVGGQRCRDEMLAPHLPRPWALRTRCRFGGL